MKYGASVVLVTLTAIFLSIFVDSEWEISRLAVCGNFSNGVTFPVVFHFDGWSMKAVTVFVVVGGIVRASSVMTGCDLVVVSLEAVLTCIVKSGNNMRPCVVSMITLLFLIKCNPIIGHRLLVFENWEGRRFGNIIQGFLFYSVQVILGYCLDKCS